MADTSIALEERIAHLERAVDELSAVVAGQGRALAAMERRVALLVEREAERQAEGSGGVIVGDERPPHW